MPERLFVLLGVIQHGVADGQSAVCLIHFAVQGNGLLGVFNGVLVFAFPDVELGQIVVWILIFGVQLGGVFVSLDGSLLVA